LSGWRSRLPSARSKVLSIEGLSRYVLALVSDGVMGLNYARAVAAYVGDMATITPRGAADLAKRGERDAGGYSEGAGRAKQRVRAAQEAMGTNRSSVMYFVGVRGLSFAEAAHDLGYAGLDDVRRDFLFAAGNLTETPGYAEFRYRPRPKERVA
jgi:hypothetical protein